MSDQNGSAGTPNAGAGTTTVAPVAAPPAPASANPPPPNATAGNTGNANTGNANSGTTTTSATGAPVNASGGATGTPAATPKRKRAFSRSFWLMNVLLLAGIGGLYAGRNYMHMSGMFFDPDPEAIVWAGAIALGLSLLFTSVFAWRTREFKRTLGVLFGSLFGSVIPLLLVFGVCFVTVEYRYRAADAAQQFLTQDKPEFDFAREYHAVTIREKLQANQEAAVRLADLDRREREMSMGIAVLRNVEDTAGIGHAATDAAVNSIGAAAKFSETRAAQQAKLLSPEQVTRLVAVEKSACYIGHDVGIVKEMNYRDCAFTEKNLLDLPTKLHWESPFWGAVHNFVQKHASSLVTKLLP